jgi:hypothetical protein
MEKMNHKNRTNTHFLIGLVVLITVLSGCLKSLNPFYKADQLVDPTPYVGVWKTSNETYWVFMRADNLDEAKESDFSDELSNILTEKNPNSSIKVNSKVKAYKTDTKKDDFSLTLSDSVNADTLKMFADKLKNSLKETDFDIDFLPTNKEYPFTLLVQFKDSTEAVNFYRDPESVDVGEDDNLYIAAFFSFEGRTMLDISPYEIFGDNSFKGRHHIAVHSLSMVDEMASPYKMRLQFFSSSKISNLIEEDRVRIDYLETKPFPSDVMEDEDSDGELFLTAQTSDLQAFIKKLIDMGDESYLSSNGNYLLNKVAVPK